MPRSPLEASHHSRTSSGPSYWARFLLQALTDPATGLAALAAVDDQAFQVAQSRLEQRLLHVPEPTRALRVQSMFGYACLVLAGYEVGVLPPSLTAEALATELIDACCGLVDAPSTALTTSPTTA